MMDLVYYLIKVTICSGVLFLYYQFALRNKLFHQWNRFYLLISVLISILMPLFQFTLWQQSTEQPNQAIEILRVVGSANDYLHEVTVTGNSSISSDEWLLSLYLLISCVLMIILIASLLRIIHIIKSHTVRFVNQIKFINTDQPGTPFSFFRYIFWNKEINLQSETGQQIFQHELVHVKERHSIDKIFMQLVLIVFWCNPFFWLIRKELRLIHEFIADKKSIAEHGTAALAAMILQSAYPVQFNSLTNQFFQTSIKRRLRMLGKIHNPKLNYISRVLALPMIAITILAFSLRTKNNSTGPVPLIQFNDPITVVIDAGHGKINGSFSGARVGKIYEDEIAMQIARKIVQLNRNKNLNIILTRNSDESIGLKERVEILNNNNPDLLISIHLSATPDDEKGNIVNSQRNGIQIFLPAKNTVYEKESEVLGSVILSELSALFGSKKAELKKASAYVLNNAKCPAVIVECGFITNQNDREFILNDGNQNAVAEKILTAIQRYAQSNETGGIKYKDTVPLNVKEVDKNKNTVTVKDKTDKKDVFTAHLESHKVPLYVVNGEIVDKVDNIKPNQIKSVHVLKGSSATDKYGTKGKNGVVEIITSDVPVIAYDTVPEKKMSGSVIVNSTTYENAKKLNLPVVVDNNPVKKWSEINIQASDIKTIVVGNGNFLVTEYGEIASKGLIIITTHNGGKDPAYNPDEVFVKTEVPASVDKMEWRNFLEKHLQSVIEAAAAKGIPPGQYTVLTRFVVQLDGNLTHMEIIKNPGYGLGDVVLGIMKNSPKWKPAMQNDKPVIAFHSQPITFVISEE